MGLVVACELMRPCSLTHEREREMAMRSELGVYLNRIF